MLAAGRSGLLRFTPRQFHFLTQMDEQNYATFVKKHNLPSQVISIPEAETLVHGLGDPAAKTTVIHIHGGGWALPASDGHFEFGKRLVDAAHAANKSINILFIQYDLSSAATYPRQLTQCVEAIRHIVDIEGIDPASIILTGDSAGGSLCLATLAHILHPHPDIKPLKLSSPFKGLVTISAWINFGMDTPSFTGAGPDPLHEPMNPANLHTWAAAYLGAGPSYLTSKQTKPSPSPPDFYNQPGLAPSSFWAGASEHVSEVLTTAGGHEMMLDEITEFVERFQGSMEGKSEWFVDREGFHAEPVLGIDMGFEEGDAVRVVREWILERA